jgi:hypothetical protein
MQAACHGKRSHHRENRSADVGFQGFKEMLDRSSHGKNAWELASRPSFWEVWGTNIAFGLTAA